MIQMILCLVAADAIFSAHTKFYKFDMYLLTLERNDKRYFLAS